MRKGCFRAVLLLAAAAAPAGAVPAEEGEPEVDVLSYDLTVGLGDTGLLGRVKIRVRVRKPPSRWTLELAPEMTVEEVSGAGRVSPAGSPGPVVLDLSGSAGPGAEHTVELSFRGSPRNRFSDDHGGFLRTTVSPEVAYIRSQYPWHPRVEDDPALYAVEAMVRKDWLVRTAGDQRIPPVDEMDSEGPPREGFGKPGGEGAMRRWAFVTRHPLRRIGFAAGPWVRVRDREDGFLLDALVEGGHREGAERLLATARRALDHYQARWGPLEGERFTLVEMPSAFGETSGYSEDGYFLLGRGAFEAAASGAPDRGLVAHEVAHAWWGGRVAFSRFGSESLASFAALGFAEKDLGADAARAERARAVEAVARTAGEGRGIPFDAIAPWGRGMDPGVYRVHAYEKGMMVLSMVEDAVGRTKLDALLSSFLEENAGQRVDWRDLAAYLGRRNSKARAILEAWDRPEVPILSVAHEGKKAGSRWRVEGTLSREGPAEFPALEVTVAAVCGTESTPAKVKLAGAEAAFRIDAPREPDAVVVDPDYRLLAARRAAGAPDPKEVVDAAFRVVNSPGDADPGRCARAIADLRALLARGAGEYEGLCHTGIGRCLFRTGKLAEAKVELETALRLGGGGPFHRSWIHLRLGCIADLEGRRKEALDHYGKAHGPGASATVVERAKRYAEKAYRGFEKDG